MERIREKITKLKREASRLTDKYEQEAKNSTTNPALYDELMYEYKWFLGQYQAYKKVLEVLENRRKHESKDAHSK